MVTITAEDLKDTPKIKVMTNPDPDENGRVLVGLQVYDENNFTPSPRGTNYPSGNNPKVGIKRIERDTEGKAVALVYDNPKDSAGDKYTEQRFDMTQNNLHSAFIFPAQKDPALRRETIALVDKVLGNDGIHVSIAKVDELLKSVYALYESKGAVPDLYNGGADQLSAEKHTPIGGEARPYGGGMAKNPKAVEIAVINAAPGEKTTFIGTQSNNIVGNEQQAEGPFVVQFSKVKKEGVEVVEARKLDLGYAENALLYADGRSAGQKLDLSPATIDYLYNRGDAVTPHEVAKPETGTFGRDNDGKNAPDSKPSSGIEAVLDDIKKWGSQENAANPNSAAMIKSGRPSGRGGRE